MGEWARRLVDGRSLNQRTREVLRPGDEGEAPGGPATLPRWFYRVESWSQALELRVSPNFGAYEFLDVDVREAEPVRSWPRFLPLAITALAAHLEVFRDAVGSYVRIACNGGYRSPRHGLSRAGSLHHWGTAADIYRIGDRYLDDVDRIRQFAGIASKSLPGVWIRPPEQSFDHLHIDIGPLVLAPRRVPGYRS